MRKRSGLSSVELAAIAAILLTVVSGVVLWTKHRQPDPAPPSLPEPVMKVRDEVPKAPLPTWQGPKQPIGPARYAKLTNIQGCQGLAGCVIPMQYDAVTSAWRGFYVFRHSPIGSPNHPMSWPSELGIVGQFHALVTATLDRDGVLHLRLAGTTFSQIIPLGGYVGTVPGNGWEEWGWQRTMPVNGAGTQATFYEIGGLLLVCSVPATADVSLADAP